MNIFAVPCCKRKQLVLISYIALLLWLSFLESDSHQEPDSTGTDGVTPGFTGDSSSDVPDERPMDVQKQERASDTGSDSEKFSPPVKYGHVVSVEVRIRAKMASAESCLTLG